MRERKYEGENMPGGKERTSKTKLEVYAIKW